MKLVISDFQCHTNYQIEFNNGVTLLKGRSGVGKTTLLRAIEWILFGSLRGVSPLQDDGKKKKLRTKGTLTFPTIEIYRQKNPRLLRVTIDGNEYIDLAGQEIINQHFGSLNVWIATSYLKQGERNYLLTATNAERMDVLNQLCFSEDPEKSIEAINTKLKSEEEIYKKIMYQYELEYARIMKGILGMDGHSLVVIPIIIQDEIDKIRKELSLLLAKIEDEKRNQTKYIQDMTTYNNLNNDLARVQSELIILEQNKLNEDIPQLEKQLQELTINQGRINANKQIKQLRDKLQIMKMGNTIDLNTLISTNDYYQVANDHQNYERMVGLCSQLVIPYTKEAVENEIIKMREYLKSIPLAKIVENRNAVKKRLEGLPPVNPLSKEQFDKIVIEYEQAKQGIDVLQCPHCNGNIRIIAGKLTKWNNDPIPKDQLNKMMSDINRAREDIQRADERKQLINRLQELEKLCPNEVSLPPYDERYLNNRLQLLSSIIFVNKPLYTPLQIQKFIEIKNLEQQLANSGTYEEIDENTINSKKMMVERKLNDERRSITKIEMLQTQIKQMKERMGRIQIWNYVPGDVVNKLYSQQKQLEEEINRKLTIMGWQKEYQHVYDMSLQLTERNKLLFNLMRFKELAIEVECQTLQNTVDNINAILNDILIDLFDEPISVTLNLFKANKTNDRIRPNVNLSININGLNYNNPNELSGGQGERISLALTLALNQINSSSMVLIDESIAFLDSDLKEVAVKVLKHSVGGDNRLAICIAHGVIEGNYDNVIEITNNN